MSGGLSTLTEDANARSARLAAEAVFRPVSITPRSLPVRLVARADPRDAATSTLSTVRRWRTPLLRSQWVTVVPEYVSVDPEVYADLGAPGRDALLAVELSRAELGSRYLEDYPSRTATWDRWFERAATGRPALAFFAVLAGAALCILFAPASFSVVGLPGFVLLVAGYWAMSASESRREYFQADANAARWVGGDAVRTMLLALHAGERPRSRAAAVHRRWWGFRPTAAHRLELLGRSVLSGR
ncbi:hypothetical protein [Nocardia sp. NPDC005978]|uniref:hypothetical protein n=1 Tax=unclassified Nocardia TaxID=2637762 RepID=UPI0033A0D229